MNSWSGPSCGDNCTASGTETEASFTITGTDPGKTYVVGLRAGNPERTAGAAGSTPPRRRRPTRRRNLGVTVTRRRPVARLLAPDSNAIKYHVTYSDHMNVGRPCAATTAGNEITIVIADNFKTYYRRRPGRERQRLERLAQLRRRACPRRRTAVRFGASGSATRP